MRQIVLDVETTGLHVNAGDRIIEFAALEMISRRLTGNSLHLRVNPGCQINEEASQIHGISLEDLKHEPSFAQVADRIQKFLQGAELIIHNAPFDVGFLDAEFAALSLPKVAQITSGVIDTLADARRRYPGKRNSLNALCDRLGIDKSARVYHGAFVDCELLAKVYLAMTQGQYTLEIEESIICAQQDREMNNLNLLLKEGSKLIVRKANAAELKAHEEYLDAMPTRPIYRNIY